MNWKEIIQAEQKKAYFKNIETQLTASTQPVYPPKNLRYKAFALTPFEQIKVVILGQDPYHQPNLAHGLAFSVPQGITPPPSLRNIFKELKEDLAIDASTNTDLSRWAEQGVLLLNTALSCEHNQAGSHSHIGWHIFTDHIIELISSEHNYVVFILWGNHAQNKKQLINTKHDIIVSPHPSPLSAYRGFFGSKPFSKTNQYLINHGLTPINWE